MSESDQFQPVDRLDLVVEDYQEFTMGFKISALNIDQFSHLFGQDGEALARQGVQRMTVAINPGYPCRVSLQDAEVGEKVLLMNFEHQSMLTPYRSSHAIFVREWATQAVPDKDEVPESFRHRLLLRRMLHH